MVKLLYDFSVSLFLFIPLVLQILKQKNKDWNEELDFLLLFVVGM